MKRFAMAALLAAFACAPSVGSAATTGARSTVAGDTIARRQAASAPVDPAAREAADYAAREAAVPALAAFAGGERGGIYIGGSALVMVLLVVIIVILV